jgi:hypothetical protein
LLAVVRELLRVLSANVLDYSVVEVETVWAVPFSLALPTRAGAASPKIVRVARAVPTDGSPVHFGATTWSWTGSGVSISDVDGLVAGTSYKLTFEVVG